MKINSEILFNILKKVVICFVFNISSSNGALKRKISRNGNQASFGQSN